MNLSCQYLEKHQTNTRITLYAESVPSRRMIMNSKRFLMSMLVFCSLCVSCGTKPKIENASDAAMSANSETQDNHEATASSMEMTLDADISVNSEALDNLKELLAELTYVEQTQAVLDSGESIYVYFKDDSKKYDYDLYDLAILYPSLDWTDDSSYKKFKSELQFDIEQIIGIMSEILLYNFQFDDYIPAIIVDGLSKINDEEALEFSMGMIDKDYKFEYGPMGKTRYMKKRDKFSTLYRMAVTKSGKVYLYQDKPVQFSRVMEDNEIKTPFDIPALRDKRRNKIKISIGDYSYSNLFTEYWYGILGHIPFKLYMDYKERIDPLMAKVISAICQNDDDFLNQSGMTDPLLIQNLNAGFGNYHLSVNLDTVNLDNNSMLVDDIIEFNGQKAYVIYYGRSEAINHSDESVSENEFIDVSVPDEEDPKVIEKNIEEYRFKNSSTYLVTQDGKIFVYHYEPVYVGNLNEFNSNPANDQLSPLFEIEDTAYDAIMAGGIVGGGENLAYGVHCTKRNCRHSMYCSYPLDDKFDFIDESRVSIDTIADYIVDDYIKPVNTIIKPGRGWIHYQWDIYFSENTQYQNEESYNIYVGLTDWNAMKYKVMTRYVITKSGKIYQVDRTTGQFVLEGQLELREQSE